MGKFAILAQKAIFTEGVGSTSGFVQLGHDVETIIGCAYPGFGSADGILLGFYWLTSAFSYKFSFSSGLTVGQFPNCTKPFSSSARLSFALTEVQSTVG
jgi:hypothetical protein